MVIDEVSQWSVRCLDLRVCSKMKVGTRTGFLDFEPAFKSTSLGVPRSVYNCHTERVHLAWMQAELRRFWNLSSEHQYFLTAKKETFIQRLQRFFIPKKTIDQLRLYDPRPARLAKSLRVNLLDKRRG